MTAVGISKQTLKLGGFDTGRLWLAPMAGYTDIAFRTLCREYGATLTVTEMVSVRGLVRGNAATELLLRTSEAEVPSCVQIFGNDPDEFARAAERLDCDVIDINMGCPMPKIVKNGDGSALLLDPERVRRIVAATVGASGKPVTVKTRLGFSTGEMRAAELIAAAKDGGASAATLHGRYAEQRYTGSSDADAVLKIAQSADIPIVYNGDAADDLEGLLEKFDAVAIGRAALANPGIFSGVRADPFEVARRHLELLDEYFDARYSVNQVRKFFVHYFKGFAGGKAIRAAVNSASTTDEVRRILDKAEKFGQ